MLCGHEAVADACFAGADLAPPADVRVMPGVLCEPNSHLVAVAAGFGEREGSLEKARYISHSAGGIARETVQEQ